MSSYEQIGGRGNEEEEPFIEIEIADSVVIEARRDNTHLVQHIASLAIYDHIMVVEQEDDEQTRSYWIFAQLHPDIYNPVSLMMIEHDYPQHFFMPIISEMVKEAYDLQLGSEASDIETGIPADWLA